MMEEEKKIAISFVSEKQNEEPKGFQDFQKENEKSIRRLRKGLRQIILSIETPGRHPHTAPISPIVSSRFLVFLLLFGFHNDAWWGNEIPHRNVTIVCVIKDGIS